MSLLVLVPLRLGLDGIQVDYLNQIKSLFRFDSSVGIAGGRDREAFFLVGLDNADLDESGQDSASLYYLDPHIIQRSIPANWSTTTDEEVASDGLQRSLSGLQQGLSSYHCPELRSLDANRMCNSLAAGFYLRDEASFDMWAQHLRQMGVKHKDKFIFTVFEKEPELPRRLTDRSKTN